MGTAHKPESQTVSPQDCLVLGEETHCHKQREKAMEEKSFASTKLFSADEHSEGAGSC